MNLLSNFGTLGETYSGQRSHIFFGNDQFSIKNIIHQNIKYHNLHQVHGNKVILANKDTIKADGHYTTENKKALVIKTADCMPVMIETHNKIIALHIGWRGLAQKILTEALKNESSTCNIWVGPHIHQKNFALDKNCVAELFKKHSLTIKKATSLGIINPSFEQKYHFNVSLSGLLLNEALNLNVENFIVSDINTYESPFHYSHRRNRHRKGLNYSLIIAD